MSFDEQIRKDLESIIQRKYFAMPSSDILFTTNSGRTEKKMLIHLPTSNQIGVSKLQSASDVYILGEFESTPSYGIGTLSFIEKDKLILALRAKASQLVIDYLSSQVDKQEFQCNVSNFDAAMNSVTINVKIGLTEPEHSNEPSQLAVCQSCLQQPPTYDDSVLPRSNQCDLMITLMYYHLYNRDTENWSKLNTSEIFTLWKQKLTNLKVTSPSASEPWKYINVGNSNDRYGLCYGLASLHPIEDQELIKNGKQHNCSLNPECPLNAIFDDEQSINEQTENFCDYLSELFSEFFVRMYFTTDRSQLGLTLLSRMWPNTSQTWKSHPSRIIVDNQSEFPAARWVQKPTPPPAPQKKPA